MKKNTRCTVSVYFCARWQKWDISIKCTCIILIFMSKTEVTAALQRSRKVVGLKYDGDSTKGVPICYLVGRGLSDLCWLLLFVFLFLIKTGQKICLPFSFIVLSRHILCSFAPPDVHAKSSHVITILSLGLFSCSNYATWPKLLGILLIKFEIT